MSEEAFIPTDGSWDLKIVYSNGLTSRWPLVGVTPGVTFDENCSGVVQVLFMRCLRSFDIDRFREGMNATISIVKTRD